MKIWFTRWELFRAIVFGGLTVEAKAKKGSMWLEWTYGTPAPQPNQEIANDN